MYTRVTKGGTGTDTARFLGGASLAEIVYYCSITLLNSTAPISRSGGSGPQSMPPDVPGIQIVQQYSTVVQLVPVVQ